MADSRRYRRRCWCCDSALRLVKSILYGIRPDDRAPVAAGIFIQLSVALAASWIPAQRAAALDLMEALRHE